MGLSVCEPLPESLVSVHPAVLASVSRSAHPVSLFLSVCLPLSLTLFLRTVSASEGRCKAPYTMKNVYLQRYSTLHCTRELSESEWTGI